MVVFISVNSNFLKKISYDFFKKSAKKKSYFFKNLRLIKSILMLFLLIGMIIFSTFLHSHFSFPKALVTVLVASKSEQDKYKFSFNSKVNLTSCKSKNLTNHSPISMAAYFTIKIGKLFTVISAEGGFPFSYLFSISPISSKKVLLLVLLVQMSCPLLILLLSK